jgi:Co/Zn/Cd efflux system component
MTIWSIDIHSHILLSSFRLEILGALLSILFLWILTGVLSYMAVRRVIHQDYVIDAEIMLITAACGVAINIL